MSAPRQPAAPPRSWLITGLMSAAAVSYVVFVFLPGQQAIGKLRQDLRSKQQHILQSERLAIPIEEAEARLREAAAFTGNWRQAAPAADSLARAYARLSQQAADAGAQLRRLDPQPAVKLQSCQQCPVTLTLEGNFRQLFNFLRSLEASPGTVWIDNLRLQRGSEDAATLQAELTVTIFAKNSDHAD